MNRGVPALEIAYQAAQCGAAYSLLIERCCLTSIQCVVMHDSRGIQISNVLL